MEAEISVVRRIDLPEWPVQIHVRLQAASGEPSKSLAVVIPTLDRGGDRAAWVDAGELAQALKVIARKTKDEIDALD